MGGLEYRQTTIQLEPGDMLALYTDGLNEACNPDGEAYKISRLRGHLERAGGDVALLGETIVDDVLNHVGPRRQEDDMCLVMLHRK
jgi:sigma-B regulation protein RsbU (phosphoserine phosphatase)